MEANMAKKIWTVTLADDLINSLRFDSANVLRRIIIGKLPFRHATFGK